jgi:hypothetical protein
MPDTHDQLALEIAKCMKANLPLAFPDRGLRFSSAHEPEFVATFPAIHEYVGDVVVVNDDTEVSVYIGHFTHFHIESYEAALTVEAQAKSMVDEAVAFLTELFADRVYLYKSDGGGGAQNVTDGWPHVSDDLDYSDVAVWSGPAVKPPNKPSA